MRNKIQLFITLALLLAFTGANAQYSGGDGRGDIMTGAASTKLGNNFVTDGNWSVNTNWSISALPAADEVVYILADATLDQDVTINGLIIHTGCSLTIPSGKRLTINGVITNNAGEAGLVIESGGSLIHNSNDLAGTVKRIVSGSSELEDLRYHFVSVPVYQETPVSGLFLGSYLYRLDPTALNTNGDYGNWVGIGSSTTEPLALKQGYMIYYPGESKEYAFAGTLNNGTFDYTLTGHTGAGVYTFNLIPNPYPSSIVWNLASTGWNESAGIGGSCYIWNAASQNYSTIASSASSYIPVGQAMMVLVTDQALPTLSVNNNARVHSSQDFYKSTTAFENFLSIKAEANGCADETAVWLNDEATPDFDLQTDGLKLYGSDKAPQLYTISGDMKKLSINSLPNTTQKIEIPVGFELLTAGNVSFTFSSIESFPPDLPIFLWDKQADLMIDLHTATRYTFAHQPENDPDRFVLLINSAVSVEQPATPPDNLVATIGNGQLHLMIPETVKAPVQLNLFNTGGQLVYTGVVSSGSSSVALPALPSGVYMVQAVNDSYSAVKKVFCK